MTRSCCCGTSGPVLPSPSVSDLLAGDARRPGCRLKGGKNGPALIAGKAFNSPIIQRLLLPLNDDDHMPPDSKPQPPLAEIAALQWWIDPGAPADKTVGDLQPSAEIQRMLGAAQVGAN